MKSQRDLKKEWERTKKQLKQLSIEAIKFAQKGEKELVKLSRKSKWHLDSTAVLLKRDRLYFLIGREYAQLKDPRRPSRELQQLMNELKALEKEERSIKRNLKQII